MIIESVKLLKTLKAGPNTWNEGTVFPNRNCPQIPKEIIGEVALGRKTVKVLSEKPEAKIVKSRPKFLNEFESNTSTTTLNVKSHVRNKELDKPITEKKPKKKVKKKLKKETEKKSEKITSSRPKLKKRSLVKRK